MSSLNRNSDDKKFQKFSSLASLEAVKTGLWTGLAIGSITLLANYKSKKLHQLLSIPMMITLPAAVGFSMGAYQYQTVIDRVTCFPGKYSLVTDTTPNEPENPSLTTMIKTLQSTADFIEKHPLEVASILAVPITASIMLRKRVTTTPIVPYKRIWFSKRNATAPTVATRWFGRFGLFVILAASATVLAPTLINLFNDKERETHFGFYPFPVVTTESNSATKPTQDCRCESEHECICNQEEVVECAFEF
jgi:hypothetical protein